MGRCGCPEVKQEPPRTYSVRGGLACGMHGNGQQGYSMSYFHFQIFVRKVPKGATVLT